VPQNRPRVLVVGVRNDVVVADENMDAKYAVERGFLPRPTPYGFPDIEDILGDLVDPDYLPGAAATISYPSAASTAIQRWMRTGRDGKSIAKKGSPVSEHEYSKHGERVVAKFQAMLEHPSNEIPKEFRTKKFAQRVLPSVWGTKGPTITATSLPDDYVHFSQPRSLTVREWARLQTFPDWYEFSGKRTTGGIRRAGNPREGVFDRELPKYTQIGNAVPVKMAESIGKHIGNILKEQKK
jgi:DNA (cytosine-5)-methyltransferase 1